MMQNRFGNADVVSGCKSLHRRRVTQSPGKKRILRFIPRITGRPQTKWQLRAALFGLALLSSVALISFNNMSDNGSHRRLPFVAKDTVYFKPGCATQFNFTPPDYLEHFKIRDVNGDGTYTLKSRKVERRYEKTKIFHFTVDNAPGGAKIKIKGNHLITKILNNNNAKKPIAIKTPTPARAPHNRAKSPAAAAPKERKIDNMANQTMITPTLKLSDLKESVQVSANGVPGIPDGATGTVINIQNDDKSASTHNVKIEWDHGAGIHTYMRYYQADLDKMGNKLALLGEKLGNNNNTPGEGRHMDYWIPSQSKAAPTSPDQYLKDNWQTKIHTPVSAGRISVCREVAQARRDYKKWCNSKRTNEKLLETPGNAKIRGVIQAFDSESTAQMQNITAEDAKRTSQWITSQLKSAERLKNIIAIFYLNDEDTKLMYGQYIEWCKKGCPGEIMLESYCGKVKSVIDILDRHDYKKINKISAADATNAWNWMKNQM